nr:Gag-Pol polyprotein [Tanacetum cinerariifolium]
MANLSEDIKSAGSYTWPPMLDRSNFASWHQRIRLYCLGKDNEENIIKSIDEGLFKMEKIRETLAEGAEGAVRLERDRVVADLTHEEKERYKADIRAMNILLQGLPKFIYTLINHYTNVKDIWDNVKMLLECFELTKNDRESQLSDEFEHFRQNKARNYTQLKRPQNSEYFKDKMLLMQAQENGAVLDEEQLQFIAGGQTNTFDDDVDKAPDAVCEHHEVHEIHNDVQPNYVVDSDAEYMSNTNMISYDQYVKNNKEQVVKVMYLLCQMMLT